MHSLPRSFYDRDAEPVARELLGKLLIRHVDGREMIGRIVETEAYLGPPDLAAHSAHGLTPRTRVMHGEPGHAYVYLIYGIHHCLNLVTGPGLHPSAVLIRALEPISGIVGATNGPGRLCKALEIDRRLNGHVLGGELDVAVAEPGDVTSPFETTVRPRIGVEYAGEWAEKPLRFYIAGNPHVSRK